MAANSPGIFFPIHKQPIIDKMLSETLVGVTRHEIMFFVDDQSGVGTMREKANSGTPTDGDRKESLTLISLSLRRGEIVA